MIYEGFLILGLCAPARADDFLKLLRKAQSRRESSEKVEYFTRAIRAWEPSHGQTLLATCHFLRGEARYELRAFPEAEPDFTKALELDPANARAHFLRGSLRLKGGRPRDAARDLREYAALRPEDAEGWLALGDAQLALDPAAALKAFARAQELAPADFRPSLGQARAWMSRKIWDKALEALDAADALARRRSEEVLAQRATCHAALGRHEAALADYGKSLALYERRLSELEGSRVPPALLGECRAKAARVYYGRGRLHEFLLRTAEARADYAQACRLGHDASCGRALPAADSSPSAPPHPEPRPARAPKPRRPSPPAESAPGDRIYAN